MGMASTAYDPIGSEISYLEAINADDGGYGDFPGLQLLDFDGHRAVGRSFRLGLDARRRGIGKTNDHARL